MVSLGLPGTIRLPIGETSCLYDRNVYMASIGDRLEEARKRQGISIREAAEATKIRSDFLLNYENNKFDFDLPDVYKRGFLKLYARYLKLDDEKIGTDYNAVMLSQNKPNRRGESREMFGRLDLPESHPTLGSSEAEPPGEKAQRSAAPQKRNTAPADPVYNSRQDMSFIWKAGIGVAILVALIGIAVVLFNTASGGDAPATTPNQPNVSDSSADQQSGTITIEAIEDVGNVFVRQLSDQEVLITGAMEAGERQSKPFTGKVRVASTNVERIIVEIDGTRYRFQATGGRQKIFGVNGPE